MTAIKTSYQKHILLISDITNFLFNKNWFCNTVYLFLYFHYELLFFQLLETFILVIGSLIGNTSVGFESLKYWLHNIS